MVNIEISRSHGKAGIWYILASLLIVFTSPALGQGPTAPGARPLALGCAMTAARHNSWAPWYNPALVGSASPVLAASCAPAPFGLSELATGACVAGSSWPFGALAVSGRYQGFALFRSEALGITWANADSGSLRYGAGMSRQWTQIRGYGSAGAFCLDAGAAVELPGGLSLGAAAFNINRPSIGDPMSERLPVTLAAGMSWSEGERLDIFFDLMRDQRYPWNARLGIEVSLFQGVDIRAGVNSDPAMFSLGLGFAFHGICIDYAYLEHSDLGGSHVFSVDVFFSQTGL